MRPGAKVAVVSRSGYIKKTTGSLLTDIRVFVEPKLRVETDLDGEHLRVAIRVWGRGAETVADTAIRLVHN